MPNLVDVMSMVTSRVLSVHVVTDICNISVQFFRLAHELQLKKIMHIYVSACICCFSNYTVLLNISTCFRLEIRLIKLSTWLVIPSQLQQSATNAAAG